MSEVTITKRCGKCKENKSLSEFYKDLRNKDGCQWECKVCRSAYSAAYRKNNANYRKNKERYARSDKDKACKRRWSKKNKAKVIAERAVNRAVGKKQLVPIQLLKCVMCQKQAEHYHHISGYEPEHYFDVRPMCAICHKAIHSQVG
uniref:Putative HNH endonuclease n=1 Tax=viral metagenome TaxID=1070528 RepID=A0A6M3JFA5_9ZZZZ